MHSSESQKKSAATARLRTHPNHLAVKLLGLPDNRRGPLRLVSTIEDLLGKDSSGSNLETREYCRGDPLR
jgi:hypothetical protein